MLTNTEETVRAELTLEHNGTEYTIISEQSIEKIAVERLGLLVNVHLILPLKT